MKLIKCGKCGAQFDATSMRQGSSFPCGKCRAMVSVPSDSAPATVALSPDEMKRALAQARAAAPSNQAGSLAASSSPAAAAPAPGPKAQPKLPAAMQARAQATSTTSRAVGAAPAAPATPAAAPAVAAAAKPAKRTATRTRDDDTAPPAKKPPVAILAAVGGVVVLGVVGFVIMSSGDKTSKEGDAPKQGTNTAAAKDPTIHEDFVTLSTFEQADVLDKRLKSAEADPAAMTRLQEFHAWASDPRVAGIASARTARTNILKSALAKDPTAAWAREAEFSDFSAMPIGEQHDLLVEKFVKVQGDIVELRKLHDWLTHEKIAASAESKATQVRVIEAALKLDSDADWAHSARGDHKVKDFLEACKNECVVAFQYQDLEEREVLERLKTAESKPWADAKEWEVLSEHVKKIRERDQKMKTDPRYKYAESKRNWVREGLTFRNVELTWIFADPYVLFQEVKKESENDTKRTYNEEQGKWEEVPIPGTRNPSQVAKNKAWADKAKLFAKRDAIIFTELHRRFREMFADRYKLPTLAEKNRMLTGLVMWNRTSFDKLLKEAGQAVGPGVRAFYSPPQQKFFHYLGEDSLQSLDEFPTAEGRVQKRSDQVTFHEGTHQLQHEYAAIYRGKPLQDSDTKVDDRQAMWFEEGLAEFMGAVEVPDGKQETLVDVTWAHNRLLLDRIQQVRSSAEARERALKWTIKEFLKPNNNEELIQQGAKLADGDINLMPSLFYARAWAFVHFLWFYDNAKYREQFLDYFELVLAGTQSSDKFAKKVMKRPSVNDWGNVEKEYEWYWNQIISRKVEWSKVKGAWSKAATDPIAGNVEGDADWSEIWDDAHKSVKKDEKKPK